MLIENSEYIALLIAIFTISLFGILKCKKISINGFFILVSSIATISIALYITFVLKLKQHSVELFEFEKNRVAMEKLASEIQQNVYDLMRFARLYVATENHKYREYFYKILDIRNGYENIPEQYGKIYWSISEEERKLIQNSSKRMTIQNRIKSLPFDEFEKEKLLESENELEKLIDLELEAFNAINGLFKGKEGGYSIKKEANRDFATKLLNSEQHIATLSQVMNLLNGFFQHFDERITRELDRHIHHINRYNLYIERLAIFQLLFLIFVVITIRFKILKPSKKIIQAIYNFKNNVLDNTVIEIDDKNEMGLIAKEFISIS